MTNPRRARHRVSLKADGFVYLLHFHERLGNEKHSIHHYLGNPESSGILKARCAGFPGEFGELSVRVSGRR